MGCNNKALAGSACKGFVGCVQLTDTHAGLGAGEGLQHIDA